MNGSYQGYNYYYDFFPPGEGFNSYGGGGHGGSKRSHYARDGRGESKDSKDSDRSSQDGEEKGKLFNDDFVSIWSKPFFSLNHKNHIQVFNTVYFVFVETYVVQIDICKEYLKSFGLDFTENYHFDSDLELDLDF